MKVMERENFECHYHLRFRSLDDCQNCKHSWGDRGNQEDHCLLMENKRYSDDNIVYPGYICDLWEEYDA